MRFIKKVIVVMMLVAFVMSIGTSSMAVQHNMDELGLTMDLPETWTVCTRTDYDDEYISMAWGKDADEWLQFMKLYNFYLFATVPQNKGQYEVYVSSYNDYGEDIDYDEMYEFELKMTAKESFDANNADQGENKYTSYKVVKGKNTNFLVFDYQGLDDFNNVTYGRLYHTVINGNAIDFDLNAYDAGFATSEYVKVFDEAVLGVSFQKVENTEGSWLTARNKANLRYLALAVLAVALIVVIIIFIISKANEKKQFKQAAEEARKAAEEQSEDQSGEDTADDE